MAFASLDRATGPLTAARLLACVSESGSAAHPYSSTQALVTGVESTRNLADAVHFLCTLHARFPGVIDHAAAGVHDAATRAWFDAALEGFSVERAFLARLAVEVGPLPSTPGAAGAEATLLSQRHAIDMLARSERRGCALGAALALALDWARVRAILNICGNRIGIEPPRFRLADPEPARALADAAGSEPMVERALLFGAEQIMLQHHGLWDLLEARQLARADLRP